jgi:hypothetical protein
MQIKQTAATKQQSTMKITMKNKAVTFFKLVFALLLIKVFSLGQALPW